MEETCPANVMESQEVIHNQQESHWLSQSLRTRTGTTIYKAPERILQKERPEKNVEALASFLYEIGECLRTMGRA